jgi:very-short-patch-repair endonuclease
MASREELLVAILPAVRDLKLALHQHWYRIPVATTEKLLKKRWPPKWLAFYQPKVFGPQAHSIYYFARVEGIREVFRWELFPEMPQTSKSQRRYYQLILSPLERLSAPIHCRRGQRLTFIQTTWEKFLAADEVNDLYDDSVLEDLLWAEFKQRKIDALRQASVKVTHKQYFLDFALYCDRGKISVETDGDFWHSKKHRIAEDNQRDNDLATQDWLTLRFNSRQVLEEMNDYCIPTIVATIKRLGGLKELGKLMPRQIQSDDCVWEQLTLF